MQPNDTTRKRRIDYQPRVERQCETCSGTFTAAPWRRGRFCGLPCSVAARRTSVFRSCETCGASFYAKPSHVQRGAGRFCSVICYDEAQRSVPLSTRLWEKVDKNGPTPPHRAEYGNCWPRLAHLRQGYSRIYHPFPYAIGAHRVAWEVATGEVLTTDDVIGHVCDVRHCVRNDDEGTYTVNGVVLPRRGHLFKGTDGDNWTDMREKGRHAQGDQNGSRTHPERLPRGSAAPWSKLTEAQVREIRRRYAAGGITQTALGLEFGVHNVTISEIVLRKKWVHVD